ncbi:unnamed protein product, partial [Rotaria magnacalcarata]
MQSGWTSGTNDHFYGTNGD